MYTSDWDEPNRGSPLSLTPWVRRLLVINAVVYLLQLTVFMGAWFGQTFAFSPSTALTQPWTFVSYMFVHNGFLHIAFNMLMLFFFGPAVEERMGSTSFVRYYLLCGLGGAAFSFLINIVIPVRPFVGASAAVFGVALAFAIHWPNLRIFIFPIPVAIKAKWLIIGLVTFDLVMALTRANDGVARFAHLGGFLMGFLYFKGLPLMADRVARSQPTERPVKVLVHPSAAEENAGDEQTPGAPPKRSPMDEVDRVLDKIVEHGMDSLTEEERKLLAERSEELRGN